MHIDNRQQAYSSRFGRETGNAGVGRRYTLEGDARPGDVLALAGGALVCDLNRNGRVDGNDAPLEAGAPPPRGRLVDLRG